MAELLNPTFTGNKQLFYEALKAALTDVYDTEEDGKNILPIVYEIFAEKLAEVDRLVAAHKNDDYLSIVISDEFILRSKEIVDKLLKESSFEIDRIGLTSSTTRFLEAQILEEGTETIVLNNVPSDFLNITISFLYEPKPTATVTVVAFEESTNTITIIPIQTSSTYRIEYTTTGDVFEETEVIDVPAATTRIELKHVDVLYSSEKLNIKDGTAFVRDEDYVINFVDGIIDFNESSAISNQQLVMRYKYRRELLDDITLNSHIPITNEIGSIDLFDPSLIRVQHQPIQDIVRVQNITTGEMYIVSTVSSNEITIGGNQLPRSTTATDESTFVSRTIDFGKEREVVRSTFEYPDGFTPLNNPLVSLDELDTTTDNIRLAVTNQVITGRDSTIYRRITQSETLVSTSTTITLDFAPVNFEEVSIYASDDATKTNLIIPVEYDTITRELTFAPITSLIDDDYVVQYDTLEWIVYISKDVSNITLITGGTLLRNAFRRLLLNDDYTFSNDDETTMRLKFTLSAANKVGNTSVFYILEKGLFVFEEPTLNSDSLYEFSFHGSLKNELVTFTNDPLDVVSLVKLKRFRTKGQTTDVITNPTIQVFSADGTKEYIEDTDFVINYITHFIKRVDKLDGILPNEIVKVFYYDEQTVEANFTFISDVVQVDYEYGDNTIDWSPSITDTPVTQTESLALGASKVILDYYPADYEAVEIINLAYPDKPFTTPRTFDPVTKILGFDQVTLGGTYQFNYEMREQPINEGTPYFVSYRYGARRDALQNNFAQLVNVDVGVVEREDEYNLLTGASTQVLDYLPIDFKKVKIYKKGESDIIATTAIDYDYTTNVLTFDPVEDADAYVFEYDTFRRDVDQLRRGLIGIYKAIPLGPTKEALSTLITEFTSTDPLIENVSDKRFKIWRPYYLTEALEPGDTYMSLNSVAFLPKSGTLSIVDVDKEDLTYEFITGGKLQGLSTVQFSHPVGTRIDIHDEVVESYKLNPAKAKEAPDLSDGSRAIIFTASKFDAGLLCESSRKAYVNYKAVNNINTEEGTISFWTGTKYDGDDDQNHYYIDVTDSLEYENRISLYKSKRGYLIFEIRNGNNKLMSVRAKVKTETITDTISLTSGDTEVTLSDMPSLISGDRDSTSGLSQIFQTAEYEFVAGLYNGTDGIVSGTELTIKGYDREANKLVVEAVPTTGTYYFSYATGFIDFDESRHFIEAAWKTHVRDGLEPRIKMFIDGIKYVPVAL